MLTTCAFAIVGATDQLSTLDSALVWVKEYFHVVTLVQ